MTDITCVVDARALLGESTYWDSKAERLWWIDIYGKKIHRYDPISGRDEAFDAPEYLGCLAVRERGGLVLSMASGFYFWDEVSSRFDPIVDPETDMRDTRFNDGKTDRQGRMWGGTMGDVDWDHPIGSLYRLGADLKPVRVEEGICCSNGPGWSPDSNTMYFTESFRHRIFAYDFDAATGNVANRRVFVSLEPHESAFPDGLTVDAEGYVWSAQPMFGRLARYAPDGKLERVIELPVSRGTSVMFGGPNLDVLYVTTMRATLSEAQLAEEPLAGSLLALRPGVKGLAETPFAG